MPDLELKRIEDVLAQAYAIVAKTITERGEIQKRIAGASRRKENSNASKGYSKLFRQLRANQAPPCSLLKVDGENTSDMGKIHNEFAGRWEEVFN